MGTVSLFPRDRIVRTPVRRDRQTRAILACVEKLSKPGEEAKFSVIVFAMPQALKLDENIDVERPVVEMCLHTWQKKVSKRGWDWELKDPSENFREFEQVGPYLLSSAPGS